MNTATSEPQLTLFDLEAAYAVRSELSNDQLYRDIARRLGLPDSALQEKRAFGVKRKDMRNPLKQKARWFQQDLKQAGVIEHVPNKRGVWRMVQSRQAELSENVGQVSVLGFSTRLGAAIWGCCGPVFSRIEAPITLCLTSPPYLLRQARAYGNPASEQDYIDFICGAMEPIVEKMRPGATLALNIGNDVFEKGSPARSLYREHLVIALAERLGLWKLDEMIWENPSSPPGPVQWASLTRQHLNSSYEPIYLFSNSPELWLGDNRRVLVPHTPEHLQTLLTQSEKPRRSADGAHVVRPSSYRNVTEGRIPRNVLRYSHTCADQNRYKERARQSGLPAHGAPMPLRLATFLIEYLTRRGDLVVDPFSGSFTTARAAELTGRRWLGTDVMREYVLGAASRFADAGGMRLNRDLVLA